ncbi:MAG: hypothetical protein QXH07_05600 [Thermoplasmata archaeon]
MNVIQKYINLYLRKITTQTALWQRYTNNLPMLGKWREFILHFLVSWSCTHRGGYDDK